MKYPQDFDGKHAVAGEEVFKPVREMTVEERADGISPHYLVVVTGDIKASYFVSRVEGVAKAYAEHVLGDIGTDAMREAFEACCDMDIWMHQSNIPFALHHSFEDGSFSAYLMPSALVSQSISSAELEKVRECLRMHMREYGGNDEAPVYSETKEALAILDKYLLTPTDK